MTTEESVRTTQDGAIALAKEAASREDAEIVAVVPSANELTIWHAEVTDLVALAKACAEGQQPIALIEPNMGALNAMARSLKEGFVIPGVKAVSEEGIAARS